MIFIHQKGGASFNSGLSSRMFFLMHTGYWSGSKKCQRVAYNNKPDRMEIHCIGILMVPLSFSILHFYAVLIAPHFFTQKCHATFQKMEN